MSVFVFLCFSFFGSICHNQNQISLKLCPLPSMASTKNLYGLVRFSSISLSFLFSVHYKLSRNELFILQFRACWCRCVDHTMIGLIYMSIVMDINYKRNYISLNLVNIRQHVVVIWYLYKLYMFILTLVMILNGVLSILSSKYNKATKLLNVGDFIISNDRPFLHFKSSFLLLFLTQNLFVRCPFNINFYIIDIHDTTAYDQENWDYM